jgi:hypothetical protein
MPADTLYDGKPHIVTDNLGFKTGDVLKGDLFPELSTV